MNASYLIFDFGGNEEAAQAARQRVEHWRHSFRLGNKITLKFEREAAAEGKKDEAAKIRMFVRVDFSGHEKLSRQRWLERIPADELFKAAALKEVPPDDPTYGATEDKFTSLD